MIERAWAAGFFDGEGSIVLNQQRRLVVSVPQVEPTVLMRFREAMDGVGWIYGPSKGVYVYRVEAQADARAVIDKLLPYLSGPKREQAAVALENARQVVGRRRVAKRSL